jgi:hypothetical protein
LLLSPPTIPKILILFLFFGKRKKKCYDLGVGQNVTKFTKIPMPEFFIIFIIFLKKNKHWGGGSFGSFCRI